MNGSSKEYFRFLEEQQTYEDVARFEKLDEEKKMSDGECMTPEEQESAVLPMREEVPEGPIRDHEWHEKVWGRTKCLVRSPFYFRFELETVPGTYCSYHYHADRANRFFVEEGDIKLVWALGWNLKSKILHPGDQFDMWSLTPHQFQVLTKGRVFEEYYSDRPVKREVSEDDIVRLSSGGKSDLVFETKPHVISQDGYSWPGGDPWKHLQSFSESTKEQSDS